MPPAQGHARPRRIHSKRHLIQLLPKLRNSRPRHRTDRQIIPPRRRTQIALRRHANIRPPRQFQRPPPIRAIANQHQHIRPLDSRQGHRLHLRFDLPIPRLDPRHVEKAGNPAPQHDLHRKRVARRPGDRRNDGALLPRERIGQRALPRIRPPGKHNRRLMRKLLKSHTLPAKGFEFVNRRLDPPQQIGRLDEFNPLIREIDPRFEQSKRFRKRLHRRPKPAGKFPRHKLPRGGKLLLIMRRDRRRHPLRLRKIQFPMKIRPRRKLPRLRRSSAMAQGPVDGHLCQQRITRQMQLDQILAGVTRRRFELIDPSRAAKAIKLQFAPGSRGGLMRFDGEIFRDRECGRPADANDDPRRGGDRRANCDDGVVRKHETRRMASVASRKFLWKPEI